MATTKKSFFSNLGITPSVPPKKPLKPKNMVQKSNSKKAPAKGAQSKLESKEKFVAQKCGLCHKDIVFAEAIQAIYCPFCGAKMDDESRQQIKKTSMEDYLTPEVKALIKKNRFK